MFRLYGSHHQANVKHSLGTYNVRTLRDPYHLHNWYIEEYVGNYDIDI